MSASTSPWLSKGTPRSSVATRGWTCALAVLVGTVDAVGVASKSAGVRRSKFGAFEAVVRSPPDQLVVYHHPDAHTAIRDTKFGELRSWTRHLLEMPISAMLVLAWARAAGRGIGRVGPDHGDCGRRDRRGVRQRRVPTLSGDQGRRVTPSRPCQGDRGAAVGGGRGVEGGPMRATSPRSGWRTPADSLADAPARGPGAAHAEQSRRLREPRATRRVNQRR